MGSRIWNLDKSVRKQQVDRFSSLFGPRSKDKDDLFSDTERLNIVEEREVARYGDFYARLLTGMSAPTTEAQKTFLECARGDREPKTIHEWAIVKLIHQAFFFGGAYLSNDYNLEIYPEEGMHYEPNDIGYLQGTKIGEVLRKISEQWANYHNSKFHDYSREEDYEAALEDFAREQSEIHADLASDATDLARSDEDGWYYSDDDDTLDRNTDD